MRRLATLLTAGLVAAATPSLAQQQQNWFSPGQQDGGTVAEALARVPTNPPVVDPDAPKSTTAWFIKNPVTDECQPFMSPATLMETFDHTGPGYTFVEMHNPADGAFAGVQVQSTEPSPRFWSIFNSRDMCELAKRDKAQKMAKYR